MILISFIKIVVIFNTTSTEIKTKSADVILKITILLKELRITQLCSKSERTLNNFCAHTEGSMSSIESRSNDLRQEVSQEALEAQRVEKLVRHLRRQVTNGSCDEETSR